MFSPVNTERSTYLLIPGIRRQSHLDESGTAFHAAWKAVFVVFDKGIALIIERGREDNREWRVQIANAPYML
jgi:hypothetical protein